MNNSGNQGVIEHDGIVEKADERCVTVKISSVSACSGCYAEGHCSLSGKKEKIIRIPGIYKVTPGDEVTVLMKKSMGYTALFLGYVLPFLLVILVLFVLAALSMPEFISGLGSLAVLVPYYLILWFFKKRVDNKFSFTLKA
ncbi:MAG: SoxR reducing system RseC family protein [Bacteroidales bacterium]|nr:SoxR reducing system RseC family protein [Bacteroidales bacterium]